MNFAKSHGNLEGGKKNIRSQVFRLFHSGEFFLKFNFINFFVN